MQKLAYRLKALGCTPQVLLMRLISAFFLTSAVFLLAGEQPSDSAEFVANVELWSLILFLLAGVVLQSIVFYFVKNIRAEKTVLLVFSLFYACTALYNTNDTYLFLALCAVEAAVAVYCCTGEAIRLIKNNKFITVGVYAALAAVFSVFVGGLTALRYKMYIAPCFDFGIFAQMFESMRKTGLPMTTCERDLPLSHFSVHLSFIYYLILPFYYIFSNPAFLNIAQAVILASGLLPLYLICKKKGLSNGVTLAVGVIYTFYPALSAGCFYDIHENCFLTPLLLWLLYAIDVDSTAGLILSAIAICAVKEDAPVYVMFVCIYMFFAKKKILKPALLLLCTVGYFLAAVKYLDTYGDGAMLYRYSNLGGSLQSILKNVIVNPGYVFSQCLDGEKLEFALKMLLPLGFLPLISRKLYNYILLGPFMLINLMSYYPYQHSLDFQYNFGAAALLLYLTADNISMLKIDVRRVVAVLCAAASLLGTFTFVSGKMSYINYYRMTADDCARIDEVVELVPADATVSASTFILPHLASHEVLYQINGSNYETAGRTEYAVLDLRYAEFADLYPLYIEAGYEVVEYIEGAAALLRCPFYAGIAD
ncbi:MAG: DUF2079 domain-containing protein [Clostridia bacterium]|nr:DUF2079 domain-containing protein [Clostridia bacterium]